MKSALSSKEIYSLPKLLYRPLSSTDIRTSRFNSGALRAAHTTELRHKIRSLRFCPADHATRNARARVAGWLRLQIIRLCVDHDRAANCRFRIVRERNLMVHIIQL